MPKVRQKIQSAPEAPDSELMPPLALQGMLFADCLEYIGLGGIICKFEPIDDKATVRYDGLLQG